MSENFVKFKTRLLHIRVFKSLLLGVACGLFGGGVWLLLSRLALIPAEPFIAIFVGLGLFILGGGVGWLVFRVGDLELARRLDERFALKEKAQTMVAFRDEDGDMVRLQRQDAGAALGEIEAAKYKEKYIWIYPVLAAVGALVLVLSFFVPDRRNYEPPEYVKPFAISEFQIAGVEELIKYTETSEANEELRNAVSAELRSLLAELKEIDTEPMMQAALAESMAILCDVAYDASSMTEIAQSLWSSGDKTVKEIAKAINTGDWREVSWGVFAEGFAQLRLAFNHSLAGTAEADEAVMLDETAWLLESAALKTETELTLSGVDEDDPLRTVLLLFMKGETEKDGKKVYGISKIADLYSDGTYDGMMSELDATFAGMASEIYAVLAAQKTDTNVVEHVMTRLSELFFVPLPRFERPALTEHSQGGSDEGKDDDQTHDGGIGEGAVFGSNDLILNPETGEYVEYGTLIDGYYALMYEKIQNGAYTEEQAEIIKNYFAILYGGMEKEEGN